MEPFLFELYHKVSSFIVTVHPQPFASDAIRSAYQFCRAIIENQHQLKAVFFYQDSVAIAHKTLELPSDEFNGQTAFAELAKKTNTPLLLCVTAAEKRGLDIKDVYEPYTISGLAEFASIAASVDKVVQFK